jgi:CRP-like cAMP-binding protein
MSYLTDKYTINRIDIFSQLPESEFSMLSDKMQEMTVEKNYCFYAEECTPKGVYIIESGKVKLHSTNESGKEQIIHIHGRNEAFGFRPLLSHKTSNVTATALERTRVAFVPSHHFIKIVGSCQVLLVKLLEALSDDFSVLLNQLSSFKGRSATERVALSLLILREIYQKDSGIAGSSDITLSRTDLANYSGTTIETFVRTLRQLKDDRIISTQGSKITILEAERLEQMVN